MSERETPIGGIGHELPGRIPRKILGPACSDQDQESAYDVHITLHEPDRTCPSRRLQGTRRAGFRLQVMLTLNR